MDFSIVGQKDASNIMGLDSYSLFPYLDFVWRWVSKVAQRCPILEDFCLKIEPKKSRLKNVAVGETSHVLDRP